MKKFFTLFILALLSMTAMAGETKSFYDNLHWSGSPGVSGTNENHAHDFFTTVEITDNEDGTYDVKFTNIKIFVDCGSLTFRNVPGEKDGNITRFSTDVTLIEGEVEGSSFNRGRTIMTVEGAYKNDECYVYTAGTFQGWSDSPMVFEFGSQVEADPVVYHPAAKVSFANQTVEHDADEIQVISKGDNLYKITYKNFTFAKSNMTVGDYIMDNVRAYSAGNMLVFDFYNPAKLANLGDYGQSVGFVEGMQLPAKFTGSFTDTEFDAEGTFQVTSSGTATVVLGNGVPTSIKGVEDDATAKEEVFSATGMKLDKMQKGLNIVRKGGRTVKVMNR